MLANLLISTIALNGIDHRSELASLTTDSGQFGFKDYWQGYLEDNVEGLVRDPDPGEERQRAPTAMRRMLDRALKQSLQPDGSFAGDEDFFRSVASDYYFGISFLDEVGYWRAKKRFWADETFAGSTATCLLIRQRLAKLHLASPLAMAAADKVPASCGS